MTKPVAPTTSHSKTFTRAATQWLEGKINSLKGTEGMHSIKVSSTGRLSADHIADGFRRAGFLVNVSKDSDVVYVQYDKKR